MSGRTIHGYFNLVRNLHKAKIDCSMSLSKGCSREERAEFISYDLCREIECTIDRFQQHPGEQNESIPEINKLIFTGEEGVAPFFGSHTQFPDHTPKGSATIQYIE